MTGLYFSATGNTKRCVEKFVRCFDPENKSFSIESSELDNLLADETMIVFGHPTCFSNAPKIVRDFILRRAELFRGKKIFIIATMGLFSGDGAGCSARILRKCGAVIIGGLHLRMPDSVADNKLLKKTLDENRALVRRAEEKINFAAQKMEEGKPLQDGLRFFHRMAGLFGQRLWYYGKSLSYKDKPDIDPKKCICCGRCVKDCPMKNLEKRDDRIVHQKKCTLCYRCVNNCPAQAITILGKEVYEQCVIEKYL